MRSSVSFGENRSSNYINQWRQTILVWLTFKPRILGECIFHHLILANLQIQVRDQTRGYRSVPGRSPGLCFGKTHDIRGYFVTTQSACTTPGRNKSRQRTILIRRSFPTPFFTNTAIGGKNIANIIRTILFIFNLQFKLARNLLYSSAFHY